MVRNQTSGAIRRIHAAILGRLALGESDTVISAHLGIPRYTVQRVRLKSGVRRKHLVLPAKGTPEWLALAANVKAGIEGNLTDSAIAESCGYGAAAIRRVRDHEGWRRRQVAPRNSRRQIKQTTLEIAAALRAGGSIAQVAARFGMSRENVYYIRRTHCPELCGGAAHASGSGEAAMQSAISEEDADANG